MSKRLMLVLVLVAFGGAFSACRYGGPALEKWAGSGCTKTEQMLRHQARLARKQEAFIDQYFFNYDINDPYRGDLYALDGCDR